MKQPYYRDLEERLTTMLVGTFTDEYMGIIPNEEVGTARGIKQSIKNQHLRMIVCIATGGILHLIQEVNQDHLVDVNELERRATQEHP